MAARLVVAFLILAGTSHVVFAAEPVKSDHTWTARVKDDSLRKVAPHAGFIADEETWKRVWTAWRGDQKLPEVDFSTELVLVGIVPGPNRVFLRPILEDSGNLKFIVGGTKVGGPGFGYLLMKIDRDGVKTINGKSIAAKSSDPNDDDADDTVEVTLIGTLHAHQFAIGGETTGITVRANGIAWDLDLDNNPEFRKLADRLDGKKVFVEGSLRRQQGVEVGERWIVTVTDLKGV